MLVTKHGHLRLGHSACNARAAARGPLPHTTPLSQRHAGWCSAPRRSLCRMGLKRDLLPLASTKLRGLQEGQAVRLKAQA